ncbi:organoarsenical effux MFS transporter ArsJ [Gammaproteobacteria bacterium]|nr:organoarsenical effux MFS transporter ArsJ [Gammaproteobacteria bacterium]
MNADTRRNYYLITATYWVFTISDGALRMLVLLHFYSIGYDTLQIALLFVLYEFAGVFTNLVGGWIATRLGLKFTLVAGLMLQVIALLSLANLNVSWPLWQSVSFVMVIQALSGIAKDLTKLSAKSAVKLIVAKDDHQVLFNWVAILTGSKNTLKGLGFFIGGMLLAWLGFIAALYTLALFVALALLFALVIESMGKATEKVAFSRILSQIPAINILSGARFFLFGARDIWFVVGLPVFLAAELGWSHSEIGSFMAFWIIGYGIVQTFVPKLVDGNEKSASRWLLALILVTGVTAFTLLFTLQSILPFLLGLMLFGLIFAINSSIHSFLILAYSDNDKVLLNVGFYYMANAGGRLSGTLISGLAYHFGGMFFCIVASIVFLVFSWLITLMLPKVPFIRP